MKVRNRFGLLFVSLLITAIAGLSGCATTGMQRSEKTGVSMQSVEKDIQNANVQVDVTAGALQELVSPGQSDLKKSFGRYSAEVDKMEHLGKVLFDHADKMNAQGKNYFEEWQRQGDAYVNPEIAALSDQRRSEMNAYYVAIAEASAGVKRTAKAYLSDILEIRTYLSNDLTPKGIETITPVAQKAITDGENLKAAAVPVVTAIQAARAELAHGQTK